MCVVQWRLGSESVGAGGKLVSNVCRCLGCACRQALRRRSELYCVCRRPYDKDEDMIACDQCSEWYHYSCVGLAEPESRRSDGGRVAQEDGAEFVCPDCEQAQHMELREPAREMEAALQEKKTQYVASLIAVCPMLHTRRGLDEIVQYRCTSAGTS